MSKLERAKFTIESLGWRRGMLELMTHRLPYRPDLDQAFDRRYGTDTAGRVAPANLGITDSARREQAILYLPSPERVTRWMLNNVGVNHRDFTFVDLGSGKGRVLLIASQYPFRRIVGVEISPELSVIARHNVEVIRSRQRTASAIDIENRDVTEFDFPDTNLLIHLYHPFEPELTERVLHRLEADLKAKPREVVVAYLAYESAVEPVKKAFQGFSWLKLTRYEQSARGQYNWLFFSNNISPTAST